MKSRASLMLMELLVMLLVFALAAALCLQVLAKSAAISQETARRDAAVLLAQNAAEVLKASRGDVQQAEELSEAGFRVEVLPQESEIPGLARAEIRICREEGTVYSLVTGWQEEAP